ncbi:MAG: hypothetical protein ACK58T_21740, partial [Phycisphaerae bacterium]
MGKVFIIAVREFLAIVATKAFILGLLLPPAIMTILMFALPLLMNKKPPTVYGHIALIDQSGKVTPRLVDAYDPAKQQERKEQRDKAIKDQMAAGMKSMGVDDKMAGEIKKQM